MVDAASKKGEPVATLEGLLIQVERSATHYDALGLEYTAPDEEIQTAYAQAVKRLRHAQQVAAYKNAPGASVEGRDRVSLALKRLAQAFSVLTEPGKKIDYDQFMLGKSTAVASSSAPPVNESAKGLAVYTEIADIEEENRRRCQRFNLSLTARVVGYDRKTGRWQETAETVNVSRTGISLRLNRLVRHGLILSLSLPLPTKLRNHGLTELNYTVYGIVRRVQPANGGGRFVGLEFVGEHPPAAYADKPWTLFRTKNWHGTNRRRHPRRDCNEIITLEYFDDTYQSVRHEIVRTENASESGLRVVARTAPAEVEFLRVRYADRDFENYAMVCNRYVGEDGFERLCMKFIDNSDVAEQMRAHERHSIEEEMIAQQRAVMETPAPVLAPEASIPALELEAAIPAQALKTPVPEIPATFRASAMVTSPKRAKKILVADDDPPLRRVLGKILTSAGYDVILVEDGMAAVETAKAERPDLVITDALMPRLHGFLACKEIKQIESPPKVIMLTAVYTKCSYRVEATQRYGADDLLTKPFVVADLLACVEKHLADRAAAISV